MMTRKKKKKILLAVLIPLATVILLFVLWVSAIIITWTMPSDFTCEVCHRQVHERMQYVKPHIITWIVCGDCAEKIRSGNIKKCAKI